METMPYQPCRDLPCAPGPNLPAGTAEVVVATWQHALPVLHGVTHLTLRELRLSDAPALLRMLTTAEVARFISPPPTTVEGFERFIAWTQAQRRAGQYVCFGVVPAGEESAIGLFQVRALDASFGLAEWGFAIGSTYWGSGVFAEGARLVLDFAFDVLGVTRLEARCAVANGRGNAALLKIGAVPEAVLRESFRKGGGRLDQTLYAITERDRCGAALTAAPYVH